jgi:hypothetical protein
MREQKMSEILDVIQSRYLLLVLGFLAGGVLGFFAGMNFMRFCQRNEGGSDL